VSWASSQKAISSAKIAVKVYCLNWLLPCGTPMISLCVSGNFNRQKLYSARTGSTVLGMFWWMNHALRTSSAAPSLSFCPCFLLANATAVPGKNRASQ
jgi:hypothetical protein